ncbi:MAG TPA: histidine phosphatase family protein [Candidatus Limnocylindria bacterium]|nr:histidine phosphatase family protein [Candidatus Limnocylindria bacterium]
MLTLLLTRHGHTDRSESERYLGQNSRARLTERGRADAAALARRLEGVDITRVISSHLERALETAGIVAAGRPVEADPRLAEMDYGQWEDLTVEEIERQFPLDYARYENDPSTLHVGGAENGLQVAARVGSLLGELLDWWETERGDRTCLLVGHASVNRVLLAYCLGTPLADYRRRYQVDWASLTVLRWAARRDGPQLLLANDLAHVRGLRGVTWA